MRKLAPVTTFSPALTPLDHLDPVAALRAEAHRARLEAAFAAIDEHHLARAAIDDGGVRHREHRPCRGRRRDLDARIHGRPQRRSGFGMTMRTRAVRVSGESAGINELDRAVEAAARERP